MSPPKNVTKDTIADLWIQMYLKLPPTHIKSLTNCKSEHWTEDFSAEECRLYR